MPLAIEDNSSFGDSTPELVEFETKTGEDFFQIHKEVYFNNACKHIIDETTLHWIRLGLNGKNNP